MVVCFHFQGFAVFRNGYLITIIDFIYIQYCAIGSRISNLVWLLELISHTSSESAIHGRKTALPYTKRELLYIPSSRVC